MNWLEILGTWMGSGWEELWGVARKLIPLLVLAIAMAQLLSWHYLRYAQVLSNKAKFARMFVFITTTTLLMITVVKTSLALSLGLVGALSIIRFRTPIKEPEELAYLFLSIAVGVGLGADQWSVTVVVFSVIVFFLSFRSGFTGGRVAQRTVLQIAAPLEVDGDGGDDEAGGRMLRAVLPIASDLCSKVDLRRVDCGGGEFHASLLVEIHGAEQTADLIDRVRKALSGATVSVVEWEGLE